MTPWNGSGVCVCVNKEKDDCDEEIGDNDRSTGCGHGGHL